MFTLWSHGELIGEAELIDIAELSTRQRVRNGAFSPTPAFARVWPVFERWQAFAGQTVTSMQGLHSGASPDELRAHVLSTMSRSSFEIARDSVAELALELRDEVGIPVEGAWMQVAHWDLLGSLALSPEQYAQMERELAHEGVPMRGFILTVSIPHARE